MTASTGVVGFSQTETCISLNIYMYMIVSLVKEIRRGDAYCKPDLGAVELTGASVGLHDAR